MKNKAHVLVSLAAAAVLLLAVTASYGQEVRFKGDVRSGSDDPSRPLLDQMKARAESLLSAGRTGEVWIGYAVDVRDRLQDSFNHGEGSRRYSEGITIINGTVVSYPAKGILPAGSERKAILYLFAEGGDGAKLERLVILDLSGRYRFTLPLLWLEDVASGRSLAALETVLSKQRGRVRKDSLAALALHHGDEPGRILERIVRGDDPVDFREDALFWLGFTVDPDDLDLLIRLEKDLTHLDMREQLTFLYYLLKSDRAVDRLIAVARSDRSRDVREQAIFWMGQLAGAKVAGELEKMAEDDPDVEIKKQAVFALSQMDGSKSIEALVRIARTNKSAAVRKQAIFWIGQSGDERAVDFLAELLKK